MVIKGRLTNSKSLELEEIVQQTLIMRFDRKTSLEYIEKQFGTSITEQGYYKILRRISIKDGEWIRNLQMDRDAFVSQFRQRCFEMFHSQQRLERIAKNTEETDPKTSVVATAEYHQITKDLTTLMSFIKYIVGNSQQHEQQHISLTNAGNDSPLDLPS